MPDYIVSRSQLDDLARIGSVDWSASDGEIIARPRAPNAGGVLLFDRPLQDVAAHVELTCTAACEAGLLLRSERTSDGGVRGYLASFASGAPAFVEITLDARGNEVSRTRLDADSGQARFATPAGGIPPGASPSVPGIVDFRTATGPRSIARVIPIGGSVETATRSEGAVPGIAVAPPAGGAGRSATSQDDPVYVPEDWYGLDALIDTNKGHARVGSRRAVGGVTLDDGQGFGPVGLYLAPGSGDVRFRNVAYKDLGRQLVPAEEVSPRFAMQKLDDFSYAWDAALADVDQDGITDIIAGPYYYLGPDYTVRREIHVAATYSPGTQYAANMITYAHDFTGDGWPDVLATEGRQMVLYENPRGAPRRWSRHLVIPGNSSELTLLEDIDDDGVPEVLLVQRGRVAFAKVDPRRPTDPWPIFYVSAPGQAALHSFGAGDINGDGRMDIVQVKGWWEQPVGGATEAWKYHPYEFGYPTRPNEASPGGGRMAVVDVNGDGLADIISSVNAHGWGLAWYEQTRTDGEVSFEGHLIMGDFTRENPANLTVSQLHAGVVAADVDRDGVIDFFTGKKQWAHLDSHLDPDPAGAAYLLLYRGSRDSAAPGGIRFTPEVVHNRSGVGSSLKVDDVDGDGIPDVVTSGVRGTFIFRGKNN